MGSDSSLPTLRCTAFQPRSADDNPMKLMSIAMKPVAFPLFRWSGLRS
ncbi:MAG: hypothetical protein ACLRVN_01885 [Butyricicoccus sp.]